MLKKELKSVAFTMKELFIVHEALRELPGGHGHLSDKVLSVIQRNPADVAMVRIEMKELNNPGMGLFCKKELEQANYDKFDVGFIVREYFLNTLL